MALFLLKSLSWLRSLMTSSRRFSGQTTTNADTQHANESDLEKFIYYVDEELCNDFDNDHEGEDVVHNALGRHFRLTCKVSIVSSAISR